MHEVTKEEFFAKIGKKDVHPHIVSGWDRETGYTSEWRLQSISRQLVGRSQSQNRGLGPTRFWLP